MNMPHSYTHTLRRSQSGMTLVELLVVIAIFMIVAGLIIFSFGKFRSNASLQNLADDVSLAVRKAQSKAIGVGSSQNTFANGYGVHFSKVANPPFALAGSNKSFILFNDRNDGSNPLNKLYDYTLTNSQCNGSILGVGDECLDVLRITSNDEVAFICPNSDPDHCDAKFVDVVYLRPNPDAYICADQTTGTQCSYPLSSVDIVIRNKESGNTKTITITKVGQISVK